MRKNGRDADTEPCRNFRVRLEWWNTRGPEENGPIRSLSTVIATGLGGGIIRDIILGHVPPTTLVDWRYLAAAGVAGLLVFFDFRQIVKWNRFVTTFDAAGLAIFTVTGTTIALAAQLNPVPAALLGMLTCIGGGALRDILAAEAPLVLRSEVYAVASLLGAIIITLANQAGVLGTPAEILAALATFVLRMVSVWRGWKIPIAHSSSR